jgi:hypothetical protein
MARNETDEWSVARQQVMHIETACEPKLDTLNRLATESAKTILKNMTKVIFPGTDERGGCRNVPPEKLETPGRRNKAAGA